MCKLLNFGGVMCRLWWSGWNWRL